MQWHHVCSSSRAHLMMNTKQVYSLASKLGTLVLLLAAIPDSSFGSSLFLAERFRGATANNWILTGDAQLTGNGSVDPAGQGWLRLTSAAENQAGFAYN